MILSTVLSCCFVISRVVIRMAALSLVPHPLWEELIFQLGGVRGRVSPAGVSVHYNMPDGYIIRIMRVKHLDSNSLYIIRDPNRQQMYRNWCLIKRNGPPSGANDAPYFLSYKDGKWTYEKILWHEKQMSWILD